MTQWKHKQCNTTNIIQQIYLCVNRLDGYVQGVYKLERPKTSYILMYMESWINTLLDNLILLDDIYNVYNNKLIL